MYSEIRRRRQPLMLHNYLHNEYCFWPWKVEFSKLCNSINVVNIPFYISYYFERDKIKWVMSEETKISSTRIRNFTFKCVMHKRIHRKVSGRITTILLKYNISHVYSRTYLSLSREEKQFTKLTYAITITLQGTWFIDELGNNFTYCTLSEWKICNNLKGATYNLY